VSQYDLGAPIGQLTGHPPMDRGAERRRTVCVLLDDPAAAALSLRTYMQPRHLMQLFLILAQTAADTLRDQHNLAVAARSDLHAPLESWNKFKHCSPPHRSGLASA